MPTAPSHAAAPTGHGFVVGFPARNEAATIADLVRRVAAVDLPEPVTIVVVDDGSADETAALAADAGAKVIPVQDGGAGLGAAVRTILGYAVSADAAAVAFLDADGEYAPEDVPRLLGPVLRGGADYVTGDRFAGGRPAGMPAWRRLGNRAGSVVTGLVAGTRIRDAQSGIRVLSRAAAEAATIEHDYNYAQVLTIGLVRSGFRMAEAPVSYRRRQHGRTFVRLPVYLRRVLPAMLRARRAARP